MITSSAVRGDAGEGRADRRAVVAAQLVDRDAGFEVFMGQRFANSPHQSASATVGSALPAPTSRGRRIAPTAAMAGPLPAK